jgi:hypothetical protein
VKLLASLSKGKLLVLSVVGTPDNGEDPNGERLADDFAHCVRLATEIKEHWPPVIELNLSCPHTRGIEGSVYTLPELAKKICSRARDVFKHCEKPIRLLAKIGYLKEEELRRLCEATAEFLDGFSAINTVPTEIWTTADDGREIPYFAEDPTTEKFKTAGVSGILIQKCALQTVEQLRGILDNLGFDEKVIFGMGGVTTPEDVQRFRDAGASIVQATTAFQHDLRFAAKVRQFLARNNPAGSVTREALTQLNAKVDRVGGCNGEAFARFLTERASEFYKQMLPSKRGGKKSSRKKKKNPTSSREPGLFDKQMLPSKRAGKKSSRKKKKNPTSSLGPGLFDKS